jgi:hypothetical protein
VAKQSVVKQGRQFLKHVVPAVVKPVHTLWHEVIGFLFLVLAIGAVPTGYKTIKKFDGSISAVLAVGMCAFFILLMAGYGISSFLKARKISRS